MSVIPIPPWHKLWSDAVHYKWLGQIPRAIEVLTEAIDLLRQHRARSDQLAVKLNSLAHMLRDVGRLAEAEAAVREAMEIETRQRGSASDSNLMTLAMILHQQGRCDEAVRLGKQALAKLRKYLGWRSDYYRQSKKMVASFKKPPAPMPVEAEQAGRGAA